MKKLSFLIVLFCLTVSTSMAQRIVYVDTEYVLDQLPEYHEAEQQLESLSQQWSSEIANKKAELIQLKSEYQQNELLLPKVDQVKQQNMIEQAEIDLRNLQRNRFGTKGDLFKKQQDLIKPIQDKVYNAIKQVSEYRDYDMVLDRSTGVSILFAKPKFDISEEVLNIVQNKN